MIKKKTKRKRSGGADTNTFLLIALILLVIFLIRNQGTELPAIEGNLLSQLNSIDPAGTECLLTTDKDAYCTGEWIRASLDGPAHTSFLVGINVDGVGWELWGQVNTDDNGEVMRQGVADEVGHYHIRAISEECVSNSVHLDVINCVEPDAEVACDWKVVDRYNGPFAPLRTTEWKNTLVPGKFQWEFKTSAGNNLPVTLTKEMSSIKYFPTSWWIIYPFQVETSSKYGIVVNNERATNVDGFIELSQWVCEGDELGWDPQMFDFPYAQQDVQGPNLII